MSLKELTNAITKRKQYTVSDCALIEGIVVAYVHSDVSPKVRQEAIRWLLRHMEDKDTRALLREKIARELSPYLPVFTKRQRHRLEKFNRKLEKKKALTYKQRLAQAKRRTAAEKHRAKKEKKSKATPASK